MGLLEPHRVLISLHNRIHCNFKYSKLLIWHSQINPDITHSTAMTAATHKSDCELTKDTLYFALTGGVSIVQIWENVYCDITTLHCVIQSCCCHILASNYLYLIYHMLKSINVYEFEKEMNRWQCTEHELFKCKDKNRLWTHKWQPINFSTFM